MKQIKIIKNEIVTNSAKFETESECIAWLAQEESIDSFQGIYWKKESEFTTETIETSISSRIVKILIDETESEVTEYKFRSYSVVIDDFSDYKEKRAAAYPDFRDLLDGLVKKYSSDPSIAAEGLAQETKYYADCLAVKALYPKV